MLREYKANPKLPLPPVSQRISVAINRSKDAFSKMLVTMPPHEMRKLLPVVKEHLPAKLMELGWDRFEERVPPAYVRNQLAAVLASHLVYSEGIDYAMAISDDVLAQWLLKYLEASLAAKAIARKVQSGGPLSDTDKAMVADILAKGGARTIVDHHLSTK